MSNLQRDMTFLYNAIVQDMTTVFFVRSEKKI